MAGVWLPVTVCPAQTAVAVEATPLASEPFATPMLVKVLVVAKVWLVTMPEVPLQSPPLRPNWMRRDTSLYAPAVAMPTGLLVTSLLSWISILALAPSVMAPVLSTRLDPPPAAISSTVLSASVTDDDVASEFATVSLPALTTVGPVYVLAPLIVSV